MMVLCHILTLKIFAVAVSACKAIPLIPSPVNVSTFCFPSIFSGVMIICIPSGLKSSGIQKVRVLPEPVAAMEMISLSCLSNASTTLSCGKKVINSRISSPDKYRWVVLVIHWGVFSPIVGS
jgi:hypothetical protein